MFVFFKEVLIVGGMLLGYFVGWVKIDIIGGWRFMFGFVVLIVVFVGVGMWWFFLLLRWLFLWVV